MAKPTIAWNEASPAGNTDINLGDNRIREMKTQIREVIGADHKFNSSGSDNDNGFHNQVTLLEQADIGSGESGKCKFGAQTVGSRPEAVFTDEDDNDIVITKNGKLNAASLGGIYGAPTTVSDLANIMNFIYPVGSVVTLGVSTNPATLFGVGTWTAIVGRVIVGINPAVVGFDALNVTGGSKEITLTAEQSGLPGHDVTQTYYNNADGGTAGPSMSNSGPTGNFTVTVAAQDAAEPFDNMPPYIVKYCWERTA